MCPDIAFQTYESKLNIRGNWPHFEFSLFPSNVGLILPWQSSKSKKSPLPTLTLISGPFRICWWIIFSIWGPWLYAVDCCLAFSFVSRKKKFCPRVSPNNLVFPTFCFCHFKPIFTILITLQKSKERGALPRYENFVGRTYWILISIHLFDNYQMRRCQKGKLEMCLVLLIILMI